MRARLVGGFEGGRVVAVDVEARGNGAARGELGEAGPRQVIRPRSARGSLPGARPVVGGLLVALSVLGLLASYRAATDAPSTRYVVAARDVGPGQQLEAADLDLVEIDLPPTLAGHAFKDVATLLGATSIAAVEAGELVQHGAVTRPEGAPERAQISIPVAPSRALQGQLRPGDRVDVIVTDDRSGGPVTTTVVAGATVVEVFGVGDALGAGSSITVTLSVPPSVLEAVAEAASVGDVTLARTTGVTS